MGSPGAWICPKDSDSVGPGFGLTVGISEKSPGNLGLEATGWDERGKYRLHEALNAKPKSLNFILKMTWD